MSTYGLISDKLFWCEYNSYELLSNEVCNVNREYNDTFSEVVENALLHLYGQVALTQRYVPMRIFIQADHQITSMKITFQR